MKFKSTTILCVSLAILTLCAGRALALEVTLRLVRADAPDQTVSTAITDLGEEAEKKRVEAEEKAAALNAARRGGATQLDEDAKLQPKAEFDRYTNYMRGIVIDGKIPFQRSYQGSYLGRSDAIKLNLEDGEHTIDPGRHRFRISGNTITSDDPTLRISGNTIDIIAYPVTIMAVNGSAVRDLPAEVRRLPVSPRLYWGNEELLPKETMVSATATFKRLTLYMLATGESDAYRLSPSDRQFRVTPEGVVVLDDQGRPATDRGVFVEDRFSLVIPQIAVPVKVKGWGLNVVIAGPAGKLKVETPKTPPPPGSRKPDPTVLYAFASPQGAQITIGNRAANTLPFIGDLGEYPRRAIVVDATDAATAEPRAMVVSFAGYSVDAGKTLRVRVQTKDALDAATITPTQVGAYIWHEPVLQADGLLGGSPEDSSESAAGWKPLRVSATDRPEWFDIHIPDLPSNVYRLRIVAGRRGELTPASALQADFVQGIINPAARSVLSVYSPVGRRSYANGADVPLSVVLKSPAPVPAGKLTVALEKDGQRFVLMEKEMPACEAGLHPVHFTLGGDATAALTPGDYRVVATLGELTSNAWPLRIARKRWEEGFILYDNGWGGTVNISDGSTYANVPEDINEANQKRWQFERNASIHAQDTNTNLTDYSIFNGWQSYQGRDSTSEVAQVEMILRSNLSLPAHEIYYYPNHWELIHEALMAEGMAHVNSVFCSFSPISLIHSVKKEVEASMRHAQLVAQVSRKFENFIAYALNKELTNPTGNTEVGDQGRTIRLIEQERNFREKYGYGPLPGGYAADFFQAFIRGKATDALREYAKQWETWVYEENSLQGDWYELAQKSVRPLHPTVDFPSIGPGWGSTDGGFYPPTSHIFQNPLHIQTGTGDYGDQFILDNFCKTRFHSMTGSQRWALQGLHGQPGPTSLKQRLTGYLASGIVGYGFRNGRAREFNDPRDIYAMNFQQQRQDIRDFLLAYGPLFREAQPSADIAIFYPFHQTAYEVLNQDIGQGIQANLMTASYSVMIQLALLGYGSEMLSQEMIDAGADLSRFKAIIIPEFHYTAQKYIDILEAYAANGGRVIVGSRSTLVPKGAMKIDDDFFECVFAARVYQGYNAMFDVGHIWVFSEARRKAPVLKAALEPITRPFAVPKTDRTLVQTSTAGQGKVTYVWNLTYPSWVGTTRLSGSNAEWSAYRAEGNEAVLMPLRETVSLPADMATYELLSRKLVIPGTGKPGERADVVADLAYTPHAIFVSLPKPIAGMRIESPAQVELGSHFPVKITPLDAAGQPITAAIPLALTLFDGSGKKVWNQSGASIGTFDGELSAPLGEKPGTWRIAAQELLGGRVLEATIETRQPQSLPFGPAVVEVPAVDVHRAELLRGFIDDRRQDHAAVLVLLDEGQAQRHRTIAEEVASALVKLGIKAEVKLTSEPGVFETEERVHLYRGWTEMAPAQFIDKHIVLIGGEGQSVLLEEMQENQLLPRPLTQSYPGPGRGMVAVVRSPFAFNKEVLCLAGPDEAGVRAAIAELARIGAGDPPAEKPRPLYELVKHEGEGRIDGKSPLAVTDGPFVQQIAVSPDGSRIAFGTAGYAKNLFVFDASGKPQFEDKIGHVNTLGLTLLADWRVGVMSDGIAYLRNADGKLPWRLRKAQYIDPRGRYVVLPFARGFAVYDLDLKPLWQFDDWEKYETSQEILFARQATFITALDGGDTIVYRIKGKAPGINGEVADVVVFADAVSGAEKRRVDLDVDAMKRAANLAREADLLELYLLHDGKLGLAKFRPRQHDTSNRFVLLDAQLKAVAAQTFDIPPYMAGITTITNQHVLADGRFVFTVGDTVCVTDPKWTKLTAQVRTTNLILSLAVDEKAGRVAVSNYAGELVVLDLSLKEQWRVTLDAAAQLLWLPDGALAAGTLRSTAAVFEADGSMRWSTSLRRYEEPEVVEARWLELEALPTIVRPGSEPWWQRLAANVDLGDDLAQVAAVVPADKPLVQEMPARPFGTYLVEWTLSSDDASAAGLPMTLEIVEIEAPQKSGPVVETVRLNLSSRPQASATVQRAMLCLGDRAEKMRLTLRAGAGEGQSRNVVSIRPLESPSENLIRIGSLYRGEIAEEVRANPPVHPELFFNVAEESSPHTTRRIDPFLFVDGRRLETQEGLLGGRWFGDGSNFFRVDNSYSIVPNFIELTLPRKQVITHVVIVEDPALPRLETVSIDAFVEARETRQGLTDFEKRQMNRGFFMNVVKRRGNDSPYNVYKLEKPVYTRKIRVYVLEGWSAITEIELYGALPKLSEAK
jgi:hypothetical protein